MESSTTRGHEEIDLTLDPGRIIETVANLDARIDERFPGSGLGRLCSKLLLVTQRTVARLEDIGRPNVGLRVGIGVLLVVVLWLLGFLGFSLAVELPGGVEDVGDFIQIMEAGLNDVVFIGAALIFLLTVENRLKRRKALRHIRELRALAHIVDMHQLGKDPDRLVQPGPDTPSSPHRSLTSFQMGRYLDYASEMLSVTSKVAALYAENVDDSVVLQAVDEIEALTTGLTSKIWQKIVILDSRTPA